MATFTTETGFGYLKDNQGRIISKMHLQPGEHPLTDGCEFVELSTKEEMEAVEVYVSPEQIEERKIREELEKMSQERRQEARARLVSRGEL